MEREPDRQPERDRRGKDGRRDRANGYDREDFLRHRDDSAGRARPQSAEGCGPTCGLLFGVMAKGDCHGKSPLIACSVDDRQVVVVLRRVLVAVAIKLGLDRRLVLPCFGDGLRGLHEQSCAFHDHLTRRADEGSYG